MVKSSCWQSPPPVAALQFTLQSTLLRLARHPPPPLPRGFLYGGEQYRHFGSKYYICDRSFRKVYCGRFLCQLALLAQYIASLPTVIGTTSQTYRRQIHKALLIRVFQFCRLRSSFNSGARPQLKP